MSYSPCNNGIVVEKIVEKIKDYEFDGKILSKMVRTLSNSVLSADFKTSKEKEIINVEVKSTDDSYNIAVSLAKPTSDEQFSAGIRHKLVIDHPQGSYCSSTGNLMMLLNDISDELYVLGNNPDTAEF